MDEDEKKEDESGPFVFWLFLDFFFIFKIVI
jgi:hypothetical protein